MYLRSRQSRSLTGNSESASAAAASAVSRTTAGAVTGECRHQTAWALVEGFRSSSWQVFGLAQGLDSSADSVYSETSAHNMSTMKDVSIET